MDLSKYEYEELFIVHSLQLFHQLKANGFWYLKKEKDIMSNRFIWIFKRTPELLKVVTEYTKRQK